MDLPKLSLQVILIENQLVLRARDSLRMRLLTSIVRLLVITAEA